MIKHTVNRPHSSVLAIVALEKAIQCGEGKNLQNDVVLENESHGQLQALSVRGLLPRPRWFSPNTVHRLERQVVPHFFSGKSAEHRPEKYVECSVIDIDDLTRIVRFLDHWGIINYCAFAPNREHRSDGLYLKEDSNGEVHVPSAALKSIDSLIRFDKPKYRHKAADVYPSLSCHDGEESDLDSRIREELSKNRCNCCSCPLPIVYYQSQKEIRSKLTPILGDNKVPLDVIAFTAISLALVYVGSCNEEVAQAIIFALMDRSESELGEPLTRLLPLGLGLLYLGKQESVEATVEVSKTFNEKIRKYCDMTLLARAYLWAECAQGQGETHQGLAVLGIAMVAMAEELGLEMAIRSLEHLLRYGEQNIRRAVPLALGLLCISNPKVRIAQGLLHLGKGLLTLAPYHSKRFLLSPEVLVLDTAECWKRIQSDDPNKFSLQLCWVKNGVKCFMHSLLRQGKSFSRAKGIYDLYCLQNQFVGCINFLLSSSPSCDHLPIDCRLN
ncbi:hypothetical protein LOK49_LG10G02446 [Camellia lanceoleosa]|uniref:Uncharacterized protein n=1 Tax=Camellia lanceoleosa TaxID=1840588 RepID=A0ACC0G9D2_9ERIC|nr:hypothetical protein LOK49_LG10G02446 [Camellia lanceoleosa]